MWHGEAADISALAVSECFRAARDPHGEAIQQRLALARGARPVTVTVAE
jgi:hypothetical protein